MDTDQKFWLSIWGIVAIVVVSIAITITFGINYHTSLMVNAGYEEIFEKGIGYPVWQKHK